MPRHKLILGDCVEKLKDFPDNTIDLTVTSPPYDNLRTYRADKKDAGFTWQVFTEIAHQLYRVTKEGGVVVWVVGDSSQKGSETGTSFRQALYFKDEVGFRLHDTMIYERQGRFPESTRYWQSFEYMFVLSKGPPSTTNLIRDVRSIHGGSRIGSSHRLADGTMVDSHGKLNGKIINKYRARDNVWKIHAGFMVGTPALVAYNHPAIFPDKLARDHIITWSNEDDTVLDPMMGSGTTGRMALDLNRKFIGIEVNPDYFEIAKKRIIQPPPPPTVKVSIGEDVSI